MLASLLRSNRLTLLSCDASPARDGLLRRGLMPVLQPTHLPDGWTERGLRFDAWGTLPLQALREQIERVLPLPPTLPAPATLAEQLTLAGGQHRVRLLLVLDAFEQHLREPAQRDDIARFDAELSRCVTDPKVPLHVLLVLDDAQRPALARHAHWLPELDHDNWLRLPGAQALAESLWSDTTIEVAPIGTAAADAPAPRDDEWSLDLLLDELAAALANAPADAPTVGPSLAPSPAPSPVPAPVPSPVPPPVPRPPPAPDHIVRPAPPTARPAPAARRARPPVPQPAAPPPPTWLTEEVSFDAMPSAEPERQARLPSWVAEPDALTRRRLYRPWWRRAARWLALPVLAGLALAVGWLLLDDRLPLPFMPGSDHSPPVATKPAAPARPVATPAAPPPVAIAAPAPAVPAPAAPVTPRPMTLARPIDGGATSALLDELLREVAAPSGITLTLVPSDAAATLAVWRHDAIAARTSQGPPMRVLAPLFSEQIQIVVRNDASWDYAHQIKDLRLNVGPAGSARARTARSLYQLMFGTALPPGQANELDESAAMRQMLRRGGPIDAMIVVSERPLLNRLPATERAQLRELPFDAKNARVSDALQGYPLKRRTASDRPRPAVTSFLLAGGAPHPDESQLRALVVALCRAQPTLQAKGSALMRGFAQAEQPAVGWPYLLPRATGGTCPDASVAPAPDARRSDATAQPSPPLQPSS